MRDDKLGETSYSIFGATEVLWSDSFRTTVGLGGEFYDRDVTAQQAANSGKGNEALWLPKFAAAWIPLPGIELYANHGYGFHSNDVRGAELTVDPSPVIPWIP